MYRVLLVDDVKLTLASERAWLEGRNLKVHVTTSALEAAPLARVLQPDLVIVDFEMPDMNGAQICSLMRDDAVTAHIPVLIQSIHEDEATTRQCLEAGAVGFVQKAGGREALLASVARVLGVAQRRHVRVPCRVTGKVTQDEKVVSGVVEDISMSGALLVSDQGFEIGSALKLQFRLPGLPREIQVLGEVVRMEEVSDIARGFGIQFLEIDANSRSLLNSFTEKCL
ncbi:MAG TPA: response regulator [Candidatus Polarisedimenticolia bacterium]|nr:response regulator [Candidatus Polarisedimenticolia bacterium]